MPAHLLYGIEFLVSKMYKNFQNLISSLTLRKSKILNVCLPGTFEPEDKKVVYGLTHPINTFDPLKVQVMYSVLFSLN